MRKRSTLVMINLQVKFNEYSSKTSYSAKSGGQMDGLHNDDKTFSKKLVKA